MLTLFNASFGIFDFTTFQTRSKWWGSLFTLIFFIAITTIFLLNMIIAVLSNIYVAIVAQIDADYNANLVTAYKRMKYEVFSTHEYGMNVERQKQ